MGRRKKQDVEKHFFICKNCWFIDSVKERPAYGVAVSCQRCSGYMKHITKSEVEYYEWKGVIGSGALLRDMIKKQNENHSKEVENVHTDNK